MSGSRAKAPCFETSVSVDYVSVEISPDDLHKGGWHHESECAGASEKSAAVPLVIGGISERDAIASLHRQAHPGHPADPVLCPQEPCRSLSFSQMSVRLGRAS